jgi:hypothetical protein
LPANQYDVGSPNGKRKQKHCLRISITAKDPPAKEKWVLAAEDKTSLESWRDALMDPEAVAYAKRGFGEIGPATLKVGGP